MVAIFFVISGYSLGYGPLQELMAGRVENSRSRVASAIRRRPARLLLPPTIATLISMICLQFGFYDEGAKAHWKWHGFGANEAIPEKLPSFVQQLAHWFENCAGVMYNPLMDNAFQALKYDVHLWTMPVELLWSLVLYLIMLVISGMKLWAQKIVLASTYLWFFYRGECKAMQFVSGLILCHWRVASNRAVAYEDLGRISDSQSSIKYEAVDAAETARDEEALKEKAKFAQASFHEGLPIILFVCSLYLLSSPRSGRKSQSCLDGSTFVLTNVAESYTPGYSVIYQYCTPSWWDASAWWSSRNNALYTFGAPIFIYSISESRRLRKFFSTTLSRYLGRISFALYLCHGPVIHMVSNPLIPAIWPSLGGPVLDRQTWGYREGSVSGFVAGLCIGMAVLSPCVIYVADRFTQLVDEPIVRACKQVEGYVSNRGRDP